MVYDKESFQLSGNLFNGIKELIEDSDVRLPYDHSMSRRANRLFTSFLARRRRKKTGSSVPPDGGMAGSAGHVLADMAGAPGMPEETDLSAKQDAAAQDFSIQPDAAAAEVLPAAGTEPAPAPPEAEFSMAAPDADAASTATSAAKTSAAPPPIPPWAASTAKSPAPTSAAGAAKAPAPASAPPHPNLPGEGEKDKAGFFAVPKASAAAPSYGGFEQDSRSLEQILKGRTDTFQEHLFRLIDRKGLTDPQVYKRANISRKHFSKIRSDVNYNPSKKTVLAFSIALELSIDETMDLLLRAGYALSPSSVSDIIITYCMRHHCYDIHEINCLLFDHGQPLLGV